MGVPFMDRRAIRPWPSWAPKELDNMAKRLADKKVCQVGQAHSVATDTMSLPKWGGILIYPSHQSNTR